MNSIKAKYAEWVLVPKEGFSGIATGDYTTLDGKVCHADLISVWDNRDGRYDEQLEHVCRKHWGVSFSYMKSIWSERCWEIEGYWYLLNLKYNSK